MGSVINRGPGAYWNHHLRFKNSVCMPLVGSGAPTNGTSGTGHGKAGPGSLYIDYATGTWYVNTNTKASPTWTAGAAISGAASVTTLTASGAIAGASSIRSSSATLSSGYSTGAGGAVTQITSSSTGVTLSKPCGQITTVALTTAGAAEERFTVTNTLIQATDCIALGTTYNGAGTPAVSVLNVAAGAFDLVITNLSASALNALMVINFAIVRSVAS